MIKVRVLSAEEGKKENEEYKSFLCEVKAHFEWMWKKEIKRNNKRHSPGEKQKRWGAYLEAAKMNRLIETQNPARGRVPCARDGGLIIQLRESCND